MTKLVLHFLIIVYSFGLSGFVQVILQAMDLSKSFSDNSVFNNNIRIQVTVKFSFPPSDILPDFSDLFLDRGVSLLVDVHHTLVGFDDINPWHGIVKMKRWKCEGETYHFSHKENIRPTGTI